MGLCTSCERFESERERKKIENQRGLSRILEKQCDMKSTICKSFYEEKDPDSYNRRKSLSIDNFELLKIIGKGSSGTVYLSKLKRSSQRFTLPPMLGGNNFFAIKIVEKRILSEKHLQECLINEKTILQHNECPFLAKLFFSFQTPTKLFFGMEYLSGGKFLIPNKRRFVLPFIKRSQFK